MLLSVIDQYISHLNINVTFEYDSIWTVQIKEVIVKMASC